jgi:excisionase family DNA binding protein
VLSVYFIATDLLTTLIPKSMSEPKAIEKLPPKANLRPAEVAAFLDINVQTVYDLIAEGLIPAIKYHREYRIPRDKFLVAYERSAFVPKI